MRNNWLLIESRGRGASAAVSAATIALETFETHLADFYVLPESNVFLLVKSDDGDDDTWEIWEGFKVGETEKVRAYRHGTVTSDGVRFNNESSRTDLRGITLKATTVVSVHAF